jgi:hypothetical protein
MADTGSYLMHGLNRSFNGVHLLEATSVYKSAHRAEWESIGVYDLWNDQIAIAEFERLAEDAGEDTQIGRAARRIRDSVVAYKSTMKAGLQRRVRLH